jgi:hypothetical protein
MPHPTVRAAVRHPDTGQYIALDPGNDYAPDDLLVKAYPWAFKRVDNAHETIESVPVEQATAEPGQKRSRRS